MNNNILKKSLLLQGIIPIRQKMNKNDVIEFRSKFGRHSHECYCEEEPVPTLQKSNLTKKIRFIVLAILVISFASCSNSSEQHEQHNHTLHRAETTASKPEKASLMLSNSQIILANIRTQKTGTDNYSGTTSLKGVLQANPEATEVIASRYNGRIERLFIREIGIPVAKGAALFSIYSEELMALQQDYLLNLKQQESFPTETVYKKLTLAAYNKLKLYGFSDRQIETLEKNNKPDAKITVYAPSSGIVKEINVVEGGYVSEGNPLFRIENLQNLWLEAEMYAGDFKTVKTGQKMIVYVNGYEDSPIETKIDFISPQFNANTQTITIRAAVNNKSGYFQPGMFAQAMLTSSVSSDILKLPVNAVIRDEKTQHIWIKTAENTFEPRLVKTGKEDEESVLIESGLNPGDEVVVSGAYLLYSEYKLKKGNLQF